MLHNHESDIPPPLPYAIDEKQAAGPSHAQGEGIAWRHEQEAGVLGELPLVCLLILLLFFVVLWLTYALWKDILFLNFY